MAIRTMIPTSFHRKRIAVAFTITLVCYLNLVAKLLYLQGVDGNRLSELSEKGRKKKETILPARGSILDSAGKPLANSIYSGEIRFDPSDISSRKNLSP